MFSAARSCFSSRIWSSTSRMVKSGFSPTSSAWRRRIFTPIEWNVPSHGIPSTICPTMAPTRLLHLARGLVGEGDGEDLRRTRAAEREDVGDARRQHARLAGAGAGQHQHRAVERLDRLALLRVQAREIGRRDTARARAPRSRRGRAREFRRAVDAKCLPHRAFDKSLCPENGIATPLWRGASRRSFNCAWKPRGVSSFTGIAMRRPAASGRGRRACEAFMRAERAHHRLGERRDLLRRHVDVQRHVLRRRRHPAVGRVEQLLEVVDALGVVVEQLERHAHRIAFVQFAQIAHMRFRREGRVLAAC